MNITPIAALRGLLTTGAFLALALTTSAQVIEFRATINAAQAVSPTSTSTATGSAILLYDVPSNTFDLTVSITGFNNPLVDAHIHEAAAGAVGTPIVHFPLASFTNTGGTLTGTLYDQAYSGDRIKLLQSGAYLNFHTGQFPNGEVRGQLIARPKRLVSNFTIAQEQAAFPAVNLAGLNDFGAAVMMYDPATHSVSLRLSIYNFNNTFSNSHIHEGAPGVSGPVRLALGNNANAGNYTTANGHISGVVNLPMGAAVDPLVLLRGQLYLNFHSTAFPNGELRGQIRASDELPSTRFTNLSVRGFVGSDHQVLIHGLTINGPDPIRALLTAKGPSLSAFGVTGVLANPRLALFDSGGRQIAVNDDIGTIVAGSDLAGIPGVPANASESALLLVLPPGDYTVIVSGSAGTTGVALLEATDLRVLGSAAISSVQPLAEF
jgi:CHRD domain